MHSTDMATIITRNVPLLTDELRIICDRTMLAGLAGPGEFSFLNSPGGTGKPLQTNWQTVMSSSATE